MESAAFLSYTHFDDKHDNGQLTRFRQHLSGEVRAQTGEEFTIFQDREGIEWGQNWKERIEESIDVASFLIPIITPSYFKSSFCRNELQRFLDREITLERNDLILPLYYINSPVLEDKEIRDHDALAQVIAARQYADWRDLRFKSFSSQQARKSLEKFALRIRGILSQAEKAEGKKASIGDTKLIRPLRVFISHSHQDVPIVRKLYRRLLNQNIDPWLDEESLLPSQNWAYEIEKAVQASDVIIICLSQSSLTGRGFLNLEIQHALKVVNEQPGESLIIPVILEDLSVPASLSSYQSVSFNVGGGFEKLLQALREFSRKLGLRPIG